MNRLPAHASVVVIGGGIMGCSTLYHLAKSRVSDAILLERNQLTSGTTWHSAAQVRALRSTKNLTDLIRYSIQLYSSLEELKLARVLVGLTRVHYRLRQTQID